MSLRSTIVGLAAATLFVTSLRAAAPKVSNLGPNIPNAVNEAGIVAVEIGRGGRSCRIEVKPGVDVKTPSRPGPSHASDGSQANGTPGRIGYAINASGQIVGRGELGSTSRAFLYADATDGPGASVDLGTLGGTTAIARGINDAGQVTGHADLPDGRPHAFLFTGTLGAGGAIFDLGTLPGDQVSNGEAINAVGQVTGDSGRDPTTFGRPMLYDGRPGAGGKMYALELLPGCTMGVGKAINGSGRIVGFCTNARHEDRPFLYVGKPGAGGKTFDLGLLDATDPAAVGRALGIDSAGRIVGRSSVAANLGPLSHAFLYAGTPDAGGQMIDLDAWFDIANPIEGARWTLTSANAISESGLIVGEGMFVDAGGRFERSGFLLDASALLSNPKAIADAAAIKPAPPGARKPTRTR